MSDDEFEQLDAFEVIPDAEVEPIPNFVLKSADEGDMLEILRTNQESLNRIVADVTERSTAILSGDLSDATNVLEDLVNTMEHLKQCLDCNIEMVRTLEEQQIENEYYLHRLMGKDDSMK